MPDMLAPLIKYLEKEGLVEFDVQGDGERHFWNRFRIQKYAFLAKRFGLDLPYEHGMYLYGPHSRSLTKEYYSLARNSEKYEATRPELPEKFRSADFLEFAGGRNDDWLEMATTLLSKRKRIAGRDALLKNTENTKVGFTPEFIEETLRELEGEGLIQCDR